MATCAVLFVRGPSGAGVKTRLSSHLSAGERAALYAAFVVDSAGVLADSQAERKVIAYAPASAEAEVRSLVAEIRSPGAEIRSLGAEIRSLGDSAKGSLLYVPQPEGDLGHRLAHLMAWSREQGASRTVLMGSDSPSLPPSHIDMALDMLRERDLVIGPSTDGGYYLIGQSTANPAVFSGIDWSTGDVLEQTMAAAADSSVALLPVWYDVDTAPEAAFLRAHLEALHRAGEPRAASSLEVLRGLQLPPPS